MPSLGDIESLQRSVVVAYGGKKRPTTVQTIPHLRWYILSQYQTEIEKLPP